MKGHEQQLLEVYYSSVPKKDLMFLLTFPKDRTRNSLISLINHEKKHDILAFCFVGNLWHPKAANYQPTIVYFGQDTSLVDSTYDNDFVAVDGVQFQWLI